MEVQRSDSMVRRSNLPVARRCSWPAISSSDRGRMRAARGRFVCFSVFEKSAGSKKSSGFVTLLKSGLKLFGQGIRDFRVELLDLIGQERFPVGLINHMERDIFAVFRHPSPGEKIKKFN